MKCSLVREGKGQKKRKKGKRSEVIGKRKEREKEVGAFFQQKTLPLLSVSKESDPYAAASAGIPLPHPIRPF